MLNNKRKDIATKMTHNIHILHTIQHTNISTLFELMISQGVNTNNSNRYGCLHELICFFTSIISCFLKISTYNLVMSR